MPHTKAVGSRTEGRWGARDNYDAFPSVFLVADRDRENGLNWTPWINRLLFEWNWASVVRKRELPCFIVRAISTHESLEIIHVYVTLRRPLRPASMNVFIDHRSRRYWNDIEMILNDIEIKTKLKMCAYEFHVIKRYNNEKIHFVSNIYIFLE